MKMKRFTLYILLAALLLSCSKETPESYRKSDFSGKWAEVDENGLCHGSYLDFCLGNCYHCLIDGTHPVRGDIMYGCSDSFHIMIDEVEFSFPRDGYISLGGEEPLRFVRSGDNSLTIGERNYRRFKRFYNQQHPDYVPESIVFEREDTTMLPGHSILMPFRVLPEVAIYKELVWSSGNPDVVSVESDGSLKALNVGRAVITLTIDNAVSGSFPVTVASNLSKGGTANCYIVPAGGQWYFRADVKGSGTEKIAPDAGGSLQAEGYRAEVLWETCNTTQAPQAGEVVSSVRLIEDNIFFHRGEKDGNALIALKDGDGKVLWSWHIWASTDFNPDATAQDYFDAHKQRICRLMDRNLGAVSMDPRSAGNYGLLWQWGRKDPFPGNGAQGENHPCAYTLGDLPKTVRDEQTGTLDYATAHPTELIVVPDGSEESDWISGGRNDALWGPDKTLYDPCPAGWRIPDGLVLKSNGDIDLERMGVWRSAGEAEGGRKYKTFPATDVALDGTHSFNLAKNFHTTETQCIYPTAGRINTNGAYVYSNRYGFYWSCSQESGHRPNALWLNFDGTYYGLYYASPGWGFTDCFRSSACSVRCLKIE